MAADQTESAAMVLAYERNGIAAGQSLGWLGNVRISAYTAVPQGPGSDERCGSAFPRLTQPENNNIIILER